MELAWNLNPPTMEAWLKLVLTKWDAFIKNEQPNANFEAHLAFDVSPIITEHLKQGLVTTVDQAQFADYIFGLPVYKRFKEMTQVLDTCILDVDTLRYSYQSVVQATLFCTLMLSLNIFTPRELINYQVDPSLRNNAKTMTNSDFGGITLKPLTSPNLRTKLENMDCLVLLYSEFLQHSFGITYEELAPTIEYISPFVGGLKIAKNTITQNDQPRYMFEPGEVHATMLSPQVSYVCSNG